MIIMILAILILHHGCIDDAKTHASLIKLK